MDMEYLKLIPGFRTALADGMMVPDSPCHMATWEFYRAAPGSRIHLLREGYVFAPAVFSMERESVYLYTYAYQPEENWTTYTGNLTPESYGREDYIFEKDCWFRLCVKREDGEALTEADRSLAGELAAFFHEEIPYIEKPWFDQEVEAVARRVHEADNDHTLKFCLLTDTHFTVNGVWEDTASNIQRMARKAGYDAIIHLGDLTDGMAPKEITRKYVSRIIDDLEKCQVPLYIALGNHDNNYFRNTPNTFSVEEMKEVYRLGKEDGRHSMEGASGTERGISYYVDMPKGQVRMIFLSSFDDMAPVRYGYTDRQLAWVREALYSAGAGTRFMIFSHDAPLARLDFWSFHIRNGEKLLEILEECNSREDYQVAGFFYGHTHSDYVFDECSFPVISTGCSKLEYMLEKKPEGAVTCKREPDTASQELWDNLLIDLEKERIRLIRFGAGEDREVSFKKKKDTYTARKARERAGRRPKIWACRGAGGHAPENTLPAFELARALGADGIQLNVRLSRDGVPVVICDETVDRVSGKTGRVKDLTLEELKALNVNQNHSFRRYGRVEIPTLAEVYDWVRETDLAVDVELGSSGGLEEDQAENKEENRGGNKTGNKTGNKADVCRESRCLPGLEEKVLELAREKGLEDRIIYSSSDPESLRRLKRLAPEVRTALVCEDWAVAGGESEDSRGVMGGVGALQLPVRSAGAGTEDRSLAMKVVRQCHERNMEVHVRAVEEKADFEVMRELGVDVVVTGFVERGE